MKLGLIVPVLFLLGACAPARGANAPDRQNARAAILTVAKAVSIADEVCATTAKNRSNAQLAKTCKDAYDVARPALLAAESGVDAWENGQRHDVACSAINAANALRNMGEALSGAGVALPAVLTDALLLSRGLGEVCHGG
ncbi:hypothetical protein LZC95_44130 [Pendulispora brunnea]|uniref:Uncharacterized protein n=1 Tax=Pendulispora brunnea TaxID=2905690 RepID=A0ABZ2K457_9BACT